MWKKKICTQIFNVSIPNKDNVLYKHKNDIFVENKKNWNKRLEIYLISVPTTEKVMPSQSPTTTEKPTITTLAPGGKISQYNTF